MDSNITNFIICGGIHSPKLTDKFIESMQSFSQNNRFDKYFVFPTNKYPAYDSKNILNFMVELDLKPQCNNLIFMAFSAGVVGGIGAGRLWQRRGGKVRAFFAFDGWGVPLIADFPIHCFSHDNFTHYTSKFWVRNQEHFSAYPSVSHETIWRSPFSLDGYWHKKDGTKLKSNSAEFLNFWLNQYLS